MNSTSSVKLPCIVCVFSTSVAFAASCTPYPPQYHSRGLRLVNLLSLTANSLHRITYMTSKVPWHGRSSNITLHHL